MYKISNDWIKWETENCVKISAFNFIIKKVSNDKSDYLVKSYEGLKTENSPLFGLKMLIYGFLDLFSQFSSAYKNIDKFC